jgi:hypothetical protein
MTTRCAHRLYASYAGNSMPLNPSLASATVLFYGLIHEHEADNTDQNDSVGKPNRRATAWEIHPITKIELVQ